MRFISHLVKKVFSRGLRGWRGCPRLARLA